MIFRKKQDDRGQREDSMSQFLASMSVWTRHFVIRQMMLVARIMAGTTIRLYRAGLIDRGSVRIGLNLAGALQRTAVRWLRSGKAHR